MNVSSVVLSQIRDLFFHFFALIEIYQFIENNWDFTCQSKSSFNHCIKLKKTGTPKEGCHTLAVVPRDCFAILKFFLFGMAEQAIIQEAILFIWEVHKP